MTQWTDRPLRSASLVFFDLETTGLRPDRGARICEMAVAGPEGIRFSWQSETDPPTDDNVAGQLPQLLSSLDGHVVVGHNLQFDFGFLTYEAERLGRKGIDLQFVDTLGIARALYPERDDYRLGALRSAFNLPLPGPLHTAEVDTLTTRALFWHLVDEGGFETLADAGVKRLSWNAG